MSYTTLLLNLPHKTRVMRRYMCTVYGIHYLFPPQELLALGGIVKDWKKDNVQLLDAIAETLDLSQTINKISSINPDIIITLSGFETFESDMNTVNLVKQAFPKAKHILFGHYPTEFAKETLDNVNVDYLILGEPDLIFSQLYDAIKNNEPADNIDGVAFKKADGTYVINNKYRRIPDPNVLPMPAYELLQVQYYNEFFMPKPFGLLQTERGCPYQCNYCVKSFGTKLTALKPEKIIEQILYLKEIHGIKSLRFIDDTFTAIPKRVIEICKLIIEKNIKLEWTCLSRADTINEEMIQWMSKAGCKRIYFGIESGSEKILKLLNKSIDYQASITNLLLCKKYNIQTAGFFLMGHPEETEADIEDSIRLATESKLDFAVVGSLTPYPGTELYTIYKNEIDFSLFPYKNKFKDPAIYERFFQFERKFYYAFYFRKKYLIFTSIPLFFKHFMENLSILRRTMTTLFTLKRIPSFDTIEN